MNKISTIGLIGLLIAATVNAQTVFVKHSLIDGKVQISLPSSYNALAKSEIEKDFPDPEYSPTVIFRDGENGASLKIVIENNQVSATEVGKFKSWRVSRMLKDTTLKVMSHDLKDINDRKVGIINVNYPNIQRYHQYFFTSLDGRLILLILECSSAEILNKEFEFDQIMSSLLIR